MATQHTPMELGTNVGESNVGESNGGESNVGAPSMNLEIDSAPRDEVESLLPTEGGNCKRKLTSDVWKHFQKRKVGDTIRAFCNYCGTDLLGVSRQGTSHLRKHFLTCARRTTRDIRQALIKTEKVGIVRLLESKLEKLEKVRESVDYWRATPKREEKFIETCGQLSMSYNKKLVSDCKTRWNSTFLMLKVAIEYKDVFSRLAQREAQYKAVPSESDWKKANEICDKLEVFYEVTQLFSGTLYLTANVYFPKVCQIKLCLNEWLQSLDPVIYQMAASMNEKFEKYWGEINELMVVSIMLDPRYKLYMVDVFFPGIYGEKAHEKIAEVKSVCQDLVKEYEMKIKGKESASSSSSSNPKVNLNVNKDAWKLKFNELVSSKQTVSSGQTELD